MTFEENFAEVMELIEKKRHKWQFKASVMMDWDDVKMKIVEHIYVKWHLYDQAKPLANWVNTVIHNQITNILRDSYLSTSPPCSQCPANLGEGICQVYNDKSRCFLYNVWETTKKSSHQARLPVPIEDHLNIVHSINDNSIDFDMAASGLHLRIRDYKGRGFLTEKDWPIYSGLYIDHKEPAQLAAELELTTTEPHRCRGYKRFRQVTNKSVVIAKKILAEEGVEAINTY